MRGDKSKKYLTAKRFLRFLSGSAALFAAGFLFFDVQSPYRVEFAARDGMFEINAHGRWEVFPIKGVNLGLGKPGHFPGEVQITKPEYRRWFKQISEMNANTVRVYTIQPPAFYEALFEHNLASGSPLYVFHGVWLDEVLIAEHMNGYAPELMADYTAEIERLIDVLHGRTTLEERRGHASGKYMWDVSPYIAGYILGIELDAEFVTNTNEQNAEVIAFEGNYLYTENASPHECWLATVGEHTIAYEMKKYGAQKPVSWVNWLTTDPLTHTNEPDREKEDFVSVDTEHIHARDTYTAGLFASYHIYPYYPEFMSFQPEYAEYTDENGDRNPYKAYLIDLKQHHTVPVLVAEYGLPSSRGCTHRNEVTGYDQGQLTEKEQGEYIAHMTDDIFSSGYAGCLVFTWQDEWFKRSWNTMDYDLPERRAYWSNVQSSEQNFGLMSFDPGEKTTLSFPDGDISEWKNKTPLCESGGAKLYAMNDERYLYMMVETENVPAAELNCLIAVDSLPNQGNTKDNNTKARFSVAADSLIALDGAENSSVLVDANYDLWYRYYSLVDIIERHPEFEAKDSGIFNPINLILSRHILLPLTDTLIPQRSYETGRLRQDNANPKSADFDSLADFYIGGNSIELRIPWQLLNIADPSTRTAAGGQYTAEHFELNPVVIDGIKLELLVKDGSGFSSGGIGFYTWDTWETPTYHERLKPSYNILRDKFAEY